MKKHKIQTHKHRWIYAQWNGSRETKPNTKNCKNCSFKCAYCTTSVHNTTQNSSDNLPAYRQTNIRAQMSIGREWDCVIWEKQWQRTTVLDMGLFPHPTEFSPSNYTSNSTKPVVLSTGAHRKLHPGINTISFRAASSEVVTLINSQCI